MTKFASMIYKMIHFIHAVVEKTFFGHLVRLRDVALWVTLPSLRQQFLFRAVAHNPRAPSCTCGCSIQVRTGWSSRTMSSVGAVLLLWTFSQKFNTKKDVCVRLMQPKHNERFFFPPQIIFDGDSSILRASEKTFFSTPAHFFVCATACEESVVVEQRAPIPNSFTIILKINFN